MKIVKAASLLCAAVLCLSAAACNGGGAGSGGAETGKTIKTEFGFEIPEIQLGDGAGIQIVSTGNERYNTDDGLISQFFKKYYGGKIHLKKVSTNELSTTMATAVSAGTPPHLVEMDSGFPAFAISRLIAPVDKVGMDYVKINSQFGALQNCYDAYRYGGEHYVLPWSSLAPQKLYYNKKIFEDNDIETPVELLAKGEWTFDALYSAAKKLYLDEKQDGKPERYGLAVVGWHGARLAYSGGETLVKIDGTKLSGNLSSNAISNGLNLLKTMITKDKIVPENTAEDYVSDLFGSGKAAMCIGPFFWVETQGLFDDMRRTKSLEWVMLPKASANGEHYVSGSCGAFYMPQGVKEADYPLIKAFMVSCCVELLEESTPGSGIYAKTRDAWLGRYADFGFTEEDYTRYVELNRLGVNDVQFVVEPMSSVVDPFTLLSNMTGQNMSFEQAVAAVAPGVEAELGFLVEDATASTYGASVTTDSAAN